MDQAEYQKLQTSSHKFIRSQFFRKITQLLLSVSVFSLFFSHSYSCLSLLHSFNFYFHTLPFQLFSHTIDKNCIFLLCNGLVVFLAKYSGLVSSSSSKYNPGEESFKGYEDVLPSESIPMESETPLLEKEVRVESTRAVENGTVIDGGDNQYETKEAAERDTEDFVVEDEEQEEEEEEEESEALITNESSVENNAFFEQEDQEEIKETDGGFFIQEAEEYDQEEREEEQEDEVELELEEGNGVLSTEELNKKFDDFIRRMKEELRIEAQKHLIMV